MGNPEGFPSFARSHQHLTMTAQAILSLALVAGIVVFMSECAWRGLSIFTHRDWLGMHDDVYDAYMEEIMQAGHDDCYGVWLGSVSHDSFVLMRNRPRMDANTVLWIRSIFKLWFMVMTTLCIWFPYANDLARLMGH